MQVIQVEWYISSIRITVYRSSLEKVIRRFAPTSLTDALQIIGKNFVLLITPIKSAVGRQEWYVEYTRTDFWGMCCPFIYDVRSRQLNSFLEGLFNG